MQVCALGFVKLSILFFYRRLFCTGSGVLFNRASGAVIALTVAWGFSFFFAILFSCGPHIDAQWGPTEERHGLCIDILLVWIGFGISDFILDIIMLVMPIPTVGALSFRGLIL